MRTEAKNPDLLKLCEKLDAFQNNLVPQRKGVYSSFDNLEKISDVFLAYDGNKLVGSAGLMPYSSDTGELVRVFVNEEYRGNGIAAMLCNKVEKLAKSKGYTYLLLDTWIYSTSALKLYEKLGYKRIAPPLDEQLGEMIVYMQKKI